MESLFGSSHVGSALHSSSAVSSASIDPIADIDIRNLSLSPTHIAHQSAMSSADESMGTLLRTHFHLSHSQILTTAVACRHWLASGPATSPDCSPRGRCLLRSGSGLVSYLERIRIQKKIGATSGTPRFSECVAAARHTSRCDHASILRLAPRRDLFSARDALRFSYSASKTNAHVRVGHGEKYRPGSTIIDDCLSYFVLAGRVRASSGLKREKKTLLIDLSSFVQLWLHLGLTVRCTGPLGLNNLKSPWMDQPLHRVECCAKIDSEQVFYITPTSLEDHHESAWVFWRIFVEDRSAALQTSWPLDIHEGSLFQMSVQTKCIH